MIITEFCLCVKCFCTQEEVSPEIDPVVEESGMIQEKLMRKRGSAEGYLICKELSIGFRSEGLFLWVSIMHSVGRERLEFSPKTAFTYRCRVFFML